MPHMRLPERDRMLDWIITNTPSCRMNLSLSALPFPDLAEAGIETSFREFRREADGVFSRFRESVARFMSVDQEKVLPLGSASQAIYVASTYLSSLYDEVTVPVPEYEPIMSVPAAVGMKTEFLDIHKAPDSMAGAVACSAPNNPTGTMPPWLESFAGRSTGMIFADETFLPFSENFRTLYSGNRNIICSGTTTKYFGLGDFKAGWFVANEDVIEKLERIFYTVAPGISRYSLWISSQAMESAGYFRKRASEVMTENLEMVDEFVSGTSGLSWERPDSAPYGFVKFGESGSEALCRNVLEKTGILLVPGSFLGNDGGFRLCFTSGREELEAALKKLGDFLSG